jgi:isoleucyl-tRNA synthetase
MLLGEQRFHHSYPYCWRSKTPIIFRNVEQFFIRIDELRGKALEAIHHEVKWIPAWGENRIAGTVESRPDWVISRQRSWGVPLPVFYSVDGKAILDEKYIRKLADLVAERGSNIWFELNDVDLARELGLPEGTTHRTDTIDVWIDSGVSHKAVCAIHPELRDPADMYLEATDQHRGWFQSSLLTGIALDGRAPYKTCVTHGFVVDLDGKKISKSGTYDKPMDAGHFVGRHGADLVRLWASSIDYTADVPFSEEMFTRLGDTYRRIRNTLRILLGNLYDFDSKSNSAPKESFGLIDRWILDRLANLNADCRSAYESFEFHKIYHGLNQFCAIDLSSLYIDITKDWLYCDAPNSQRRRATQTTMHRIFDTLCRLLAPILVFTAEEAWIRFRSSGSVHLQDFFEGGPLDANAENLFQQALYVRTMLGPHIERQRSQGMIGTSQEASILLEYSDGDELLGDWWLSQTELLAQILIVSEVNLAKRESLQIAVTKTSHQKCARCWRHRAYVGTSKTHPDLCDRCEDVVVNRSRSA